MGIREAFIKITALESAGYVEDGRVNFIFDTGSAYSYIDRNIVKKLGLETVNSKERKCITVDSSEITSRKEAKNKINNQGDNVTLIM